jgi:hypothetical protein
VPSRATAFPNRDAAWLINIPAMWEDVEETEREIAWARRTYAALEPHLSDGKYINFMGPTNPMTAPGRSRRLGRPTIGEARLRPRERLPA